MDTKKIHTCIRCSKAFRGEGCMGYCSSRCKASLEYKKIWRKEILDSSKQCLGCGVQFNTANNQKKYCSYQCCDKARYVEDTKDQIKNAKDRWMSPQEPNNKKSFHELNSMSEYRRVFDDESWANRFNAK